MQHSDAGADEGRPHPQRYDSIHANMAKGHAPADENRCDATRRDGLPLPREQQESKKISKSTTPSSPLTTAPAPAVSATNPPRHERKHSDDVCPSSESDARLSVQSRPRGPRYIGWTLACPHYVRSSSVLRTVRPNKGEVRDTRQPVGVSRWCRGAEQARRRVWDARARAHRLVWGHLLHPWVGRLVARS
ncbi:hypothetical protein BC567DRAFT_235484 [Phyllosticta citribraziliensis]